MRILHLTTFLQGGAGRIIAALAIVQQRAGHEVVVVADDGRHAGYESYPEYIAQLAGAGVAFHTVTSTFARDVALNVQAAREVRSVLGASTIDVAHTHAAIPSLVAMLALNRRRAVPILQTMHGWGIQKTTEQAATDITILGLTDAVVTPSAAARDTLCRLGLEPSHVRVIPYGLDAAPANPAPDPRDRALFERMRAEGSSIALCIGTIGERKQQTLVVRALPSVPAVAAVFIGDGDTVPLQALAEELGVADRVHLLGYRTDASRYLPSADVLVLPSKNEGLPIVVLESFRVGVPVVASAIPEISEAIEEGRTGFLFPPGDTAGLVAALTKALVKERNASMRAQARQAFVARYGAERMIADYERLYTQLRSPSARSAAGAHGAGAG